MLIDGIDDSIDEDIREPTDALRECCWNCARCSRCHRNMTHEDCRFIENRWQNRTSGISTGEFDDLIRRFLMSYSYDMSINIGNVVATLNIEDIYDFGRDILLPNMIGTTISEDELLKDLCELAQEQIELSDTDPYDEFEPNILIREYNILAQLFLHRPTRIRPRVVQILNSMKDDHMEEVDIGVLLKLEDDTNTIKSFSKKHLGKLRRVTGVVEQRSEIRSYDIVSAFQCQYKLSETQTCNKIVRVRQDGEKTNKKPVCNEHKQQGKFLHLPNLSETGNVLYIKIREMNYDSQPRSIILRAYDHSIEEVEIGDEVSITGIWKGVLKDERAEYENYLDVTHIERIDYEKISRDINEDRYAELIDIVEKDNYVESIKQSFAKNVVGFRNTKLALFLQQVNSNDITKRGNVQNRGTINILFIGDPGTGKTELAKYVTKVGPKSGKVSGPRLTLAGATFGAEKGEKDFGKGGWTVKGGALVMHNQGTLIIDELNRTSSEVKEGINDPMEDGWAEGWLAGQRASFRTRTNVLGLANPKYGFFKDEDIVNLNEQFNLTPQFLSRFDYIKIFKGDYTDEDNMDEIMDTMLEHFDEEELEEDENQEDIISEEDFKDLIYSAKQLDVTYGDKVKKILKDYMQGILDRVINSFNEAQKRDVDKPRFTIRLLNSLRRFSMASARAHLREEVTEEDCDLAWEVMMDWLDELYKDENGIWDFSTYEVSDSQQSYTYEDVMKHIKDLLREERRTTFNKEDLLYYTKTRGKSYSYMEDIFVKPAFDRQEIKSWGTNTWRLVNMFDNDYEDKKTDITEEKESPPEDDRPPIWQP